MNSEIHEYEISAKIGSGAIFVNGAIEFWNRDSGSLWLPFEKEQIREFSQVKPNQYISIRGYAKWINDKTFALVPTPFSNQTYIVCRNSTDRLPNQNAYISVEGKTKWARLSQSRPASTLFKGNVILNVLNWHTESPVIRHTDLYDHYGLPRDFALRDFKRDLVGPIDDLDPTLTDFLVFTVLGTTSFENYAGGINLTLYDATNKDMSAAILRQMQRTLPRRINEPFSIATPFGSFDLRCDYGFHVGNADAELSSRIRNLLENRTRSAVGLKQTSLSLHSKNRTPASFEDKPCALSDIPTVVPETAVMRKRPQPVDPDSFKFILMQHLHEPSIPNFTEPLADFSKRMETLVEKYDLNPIQLTQYGFLNANINARPMSVLRQSLAYVRAQNIEVITTDEINKGLDYFEWNLRYVYEIWEDLFKDKERSPSMPDKSEYGEIRRILRRYDQGTGVSEEIILKEAQTKPQKTMELIKEMWLVGWIFERDHRSWRLTYG